MKNTLFAAGLALAALPLATESLRFTVEAEDVVSSVWTITAHRETQTSTMSLMGNDQDVGSGQTSTRVLSIELLDEYIKVSEDGAPLSIARSIETVDSEFTHEDSDNDREAESELTGETVVFTFDPESEEWSAAFGEDSDGDTDWLDDLSPRVDLARALPEEDPEVGDSWEVPPAFLEDVLRPGGTLMVQESEDGDPDDDEEGRIEIKLPSGDELAQFEDYEGELVATLVEIVEEDDLKLARITIAVDVEVDLDISEELEEQAEERGSNEAYSHASLVRTLEGELTILWDLENRRPYSLEGELDGYTEMHLEWTSSTHEMELEIGFVNETSVTHTIEATFGD